MDDFITGTTRGGTSWTPMFIAELNKENCIGCGRCFKVCPRDVFELVEREGEDEDDDDDFSDDTTMVMSISNPLDCIGCQACDKVCPKNCHSHSPAPMAA